jgi:hypothetical protein|nr:MAG TPA: hypothetical protein [Siphoviridae sp. ctgbm9]
MEAKINIAEILKDKPNGTKLYADAFGELSFDGVVSNKDEIIFTKNKVNTSWCFYNDGKYSKYGESILVPSKEMRNWSKFAWKKGDILVGCAKKIIFDRFTDDTYSYFEGKYCLEQDPYSDYETYRGEDKGLLTKYFHIPEQCIAQSYIKNIEERLGGKLNMETLEIEKAQPEFKDGDILSNPSTALPKNHIFIFSKFNKYKDFEHHVALTASGEITIPTSHGAWCRKDSGVKYATEEEKQRLFEALAKEGKAWDAEKKAIVDLKPKVELKPFDKVLVRDRKTYHWEVDLFGFKTEGPNIVYHCVGGSWKFCIPYIGNESLLGTIKDAEK